MNFINTLITGGVIGGIVTIVNALLQRKWQRQDGKDAVIAKLSEIEKKLDDHIKADETGNMKLTRARILSFNDEIRRGTLHSEEHFTDCLDDIDHYERYCREHPDYPNNKAQAAIRHIKEVYDKCLRENNFL